MLLINMHEAIVVLFDCFPLCITRDTAILQEPLLQLLRKHMDSKGKQAKLKSPAELQELLDVTRCVAIIIPAASRRLIHTRHNAAVSM